MRRSNLKVMVTGGCGFIGTNFIKHIQKAWDCDIVNIDSLTYAGIKSNHENTSKYRLAKVDISTSYISMENWIHGFNPDIIVHFAAESHVDNSITSADKFVKTNVVGTYNILEAIKNVSPKTPLVHISTDEVYGDFNLNYDGYGWNEDAPYAPNSPYAASKASADMLVRAFSHTHNLTTVTVNCSNNYGPYQNPEKFIPKIITNVLSGRKVPVYGNGLNRRDWIYVTDHCTYLQFVISDLFDGGVCERYNIGYNTNYTNLDLAKLIITSMNKNPDDYIEFVEDRKAHDRVYKINTTRINNHLEDYKMRTYDQDFAGFKPKTLHEGLERTIDWYKNNRIWWEDLI